LNSLNNIQKRLFVGILGAALIMFLIFLSPWTFFLMILALSVSTQVEFYLLAGVDGKFPLKTYGTLVGSLIVGLTYFVKAGLIDPRFFLILFPLVSFIFIIKLYQKELKPFTNIAYTILGIVYVALPYSLLIWIAFKEDHYDPEIMAGVFLLLWASDSGAYFAGKFLGNRKLFERISPKKTWEGFIGGGVLAFLMALTLSYYFEELQIWQWMVLAAILVVMGSYGDLVESLFKRSLQIKDSGVGLPGHGGFLDRFDGLLVSAPFIAIFIEWI
jgi:phosphatidate cytidylyltransferase